MFSRITNIRNFGVFGNFSGGALPEFSAFNLIYGWNYSGKTTLSRVFRCLEQGKLHPDYPTAQFAISHSDGIARDQEFGATTTVRVFNEDFRKEHLLWDDADGFNPILLLGAENIEKRNTLVAKQKELATWLDNARIADEEASKLTEVINRAESECATQIVKELGVGRFDRRHIRQITDAWKGTIPDELGVDVFRSERAKVAAEPKEVVQDLVVDTTFVENEWRNAVELLGEQIGSTATIPRLAEYPDIGSWVEVGLHLHKDVSRCEFCEGAISSGRMASLNAHFSKAFADLKTRIGEASEALVDRVVTSDGNAYAKAKFYSDLHSELADALAAFSVARVEFNSALEDLVQRLERKESNPFDIVEPPSNMPETNSLAKSVERVQRIIDENNARSRDFKAERDAAIRRLKDHYAAAAMRRINLYQTRAEADNFETAAQTATFRAEELKTEIIELQAQLSEATKGAEAINDALGRFFGKRDIQVRVTEGDKYQLMRGTSPARNLSEGERTAIAFCYFVTKLVENGNELAQTIVYIDDPISSLDSHHLLHINAFIKNSFLKFDATANPKWACLAKQLFVSTHNYEFFHLTWEWMRKPRGMATAFMIERADANGSASSRMIECPKSILQFRSEYLFLFNQLAAYAATPSSDPLVIFNLGNMARRFVEGYLAFKFFEFNAVDEKLPLVIIDPVQCERARKFMHFYSHSLSRGGGMKLPDMAEAQASLKSILDGIKAHDPVHYGALETAT